MKTAFASDFDNTLYFRDGFQKDDIIEIQKKQKEGLLFGVCTGRSLNGVLVPTEGKINYDFYIVSTGSLILDRDQKVLYSKPIPRDAIEKINDLYATKYNIAYNSGYDFHSLHDDYEIMRSIQSLHELPPILYGISFLSESICKAKEICEYLNKTISVSAYNNGPFVDITSKGSSKGKALKIFKSIKSIDVMACMGDSYNDMTMLKEADLSFTFPSSPEEVRHVASQIRPSLEEALRML